MVRRQGVTLVEVLAAMGIMAIGMLAVLVLFPLGAMSMARALMDDRCAAVAANADSLARAMDYRGDGSFANWLAPNFTPPTPHGAPVTPVPGPSDPFGNGYAVFIDPYFARVPGGVPATTGGPSPNPRPDEYLVYPTVRRMMPGPPAIPVVTAIPPVVTLQNQLDAIDRLFMFRDDLGFSLNGYPKESSDGRYTWSYLLRRPQTGRIRSTELSVIVYSGRVTEVPVAEVTYGVTGESGALVLNDTAMVLGWAVGQERPELRRGHWLFDSTPVRAERPVGSGRFYGSVNARFYRIMDVADAGANQLRVEVQPPLRDGTVTQMTVMPAVVQVFERGAK